MSMVTVTLVWGLLGTPSRQIFALNVVVSVMRNAAATPIITDTMWDDCDVWSKITTGLSLLNCSATGSVQSGVDSPSKVTERRAFNGSVPYGSANTSTSTGLVPCVGVIVGATAAQTARGEAHAQSPTAIQPYLSTSMPCTDHSCSLH